MRHTLASLKAKHAIRHSRAFIAPSIKPRACDRRLGAGREHGPFVALQQFQGLFHHRHHFSISLSLSPSPSSTCSLLIAATLRRVHQVSPRRLNSISNPYSSIRACPLTPLNPQSPCRSVAVTACSFLASLSLSLSASLPQTCMPAKLSTSHRRSSLR